MVARGPDAEGYHIDEAAAMFLGHRRLAIRDLEGGGQPMWNRSRTLAVVYNGEIYNHEELRAELERLGHRFVTSHSDTEVLIHGYAEWGDTLASRINGMFAFAVMDTQKHSLYLARDRFGEKPLYTYSCNGLFAFASELDALVRHSQIAAEPDRRALAKLFGYGYIPAPAALYRDTAKLPAGHQMRVDFSGEAPVVRTERYWHLALCPDDTMAERGEDDLADELLALLHQSVERRLVSDVPVGLFLSSGLDSGSILDAMSASEGLGPVQSFTIGFREQSYDERPGARALAEHFGAEHHENTLDFESALQSVPEVLGRLDEPFADASIIPTRLVSAFASKKVRVALSGDGGDEMLAGYDPFRALAPARFYARVMPRSGHALARRLVEALPCSSRNMSLDFKLRRALMGVGYPEGAWAPVWMAPIDPALMGELLEDPPQFEEIYDDALDLWESGPAKSRGDRLLQFFTALYLQNDILTKLDRASMMESLETRTVFLDNDFVDFCARLPFRYKFRNGQGKYLLRKALAKRLPASTLRRPKKGFGIPLDQWLRRYAMGDGGRPPAIPDFPGVSKRYVESAWHAQGRGREDHRYLLWTCLSLHHVAINRPGGEA
jgi:asparagine synthase (glutamine-hydrolysing)